MSAHSCTGDLALSLQNRDGIAAIWQLHRAAARANRDGNRLAARSIVEICRRGGAAVPPRTGTLRGRPPNARRRRAAICVTKEAVFWIDTN